MMPEEIHTARLVLRPYRLLDVPDVLKYATHAEWARFLPVPRPYTERDALDFLTRSTQADRNTHPNWAITLQARVIGGIDILFTPDFRVGQIGYSIAPDTWNQGLCTEAAKSVVGAAFAHFATLTTIRSHADRRNTASIRVMQKVGMKYDDGVKTNRFINGEFVDDEHYSLSRQEWNPGG